jgi:hypothetical protein
MLQIDTEEYNDTYRFLTEIVMRMAAIAHPTDVNFTMMKAFLTSLTTSHIWDYLDTHDNIIISNDLLDDLDIDMRRVLNTLRETFDLPPLVTCAFPTECKPVESLQIAQTIATPDFVACVDELSGAGYHATNDALTQWRNDIGYTASIDYIKEIPQYSVCYHPQLAEKSTPSVYSRLSKLELGASLYQERVQRMARELEISAACYGSRNKAMAAMCAQLNTAYIDLNSQRAYINERVVEFRNYALISVTISACVIVISIADFIGYLFH